MDNSAQKGFWEDFEFEKTQKRNHHKHVMSSWKSQSRNNKNRIIETIIDA